MYCSNCGSLLNEKHNFCVKCGTPVLKRARNYVPQRTSLEKPNEGLTYNAGSPLPREKKGENYSTPNEASNLPTICIYCGNILPSGISFCDKCNKSL